MKIKLYPLIWWYFSCAILQLLQFPNPLRKFERSRIFAQTVNNTCDIALSQLPDPRIKGEMVAVKIAEDVYLASLNACKNHLYGRVVLAKGDPSLT